MEKYIIIDRLTVQEALQKQMRYDSEVAALIAGQDPRKILVLTQGVASGNCKRGIESDEQFDNRMIMSIGFVGDIKDLAPSYITAKFKDEIDIEKHFLSTLLGGDSDTAGHILHAGRVLDYIKQYYKLK